MLCIHFQPKLISFTVGGLFKEFPNGDINSNSDGEIRFFERHYVIVPAGGGFCIRNEMVFINSATSVQSRSFLKPLPAIQAPAATTTTAATTANFNNNNNNNVLPSNMNSMTTSSIQSRLQMHQNASNMNCNLMGLNPAVGSSALPAYPSESQVQAAPAVNANAAPLDDMAKMQLVQTLSVQTNMNLEWSKK